MNYHSSRTEKKKEKRMSDLDEKGFEITQKRRNNKDFKEKKMPT